MTDSSRYNRWQGLAINQFSVTVALMTAFSASALGTGFSFLQSTTFKTEHRHLFALALLSLLLSALLSCSPVISRALDFRFTARKVRRQMEPTYSQPLTFFGITSDGFGRLTWRLFWTSVITLIIGVGGLVIRVACAYSDRLF